MTHTCENCGKSFETRSCFRQHNCSPSGEIVGRDEDSSDTNNISSRTQFQSSLSHLEELRRIFQKLISPTPWPPNQGFEQYLCETIASSDLYQYAWIAEVQPTQSTLDTCYGANLPEEYLPCIQKQPISDIEDGVIERALQTGSVHVRHRPPDLERPERTTPSDTPPESTTIIAVPIAHGKHTHGILVLTTQRSESITEPEYQWFEILGRVLGIAVKVIRQQELLFGHKGIEIELRIPDSDKFFATISEELDCRCIHLGDEISEDGDIIHYHRIEGADPNTVVAAASEYDGITYHQFLSEEDDGFRFKSTTTESFVPVCLDFGGHIRHGVVENGTAYLTLELPLSADIEQFINTLQTKHPSLELVSKKEIQTGVRSLSRARLDPQSGQVLTDQQQNAIETAFRRGYYEWPRGETAEEIAEAMGVSPPTFHRHRRDAEKKLIKHALFAENRQT